MTSLILSIIGLVLLGALGWVFLRQLRVLLHTIPDPQPPDRPSEDALQAIWESLNQLERMTGDRLETLTRAVADGIDHVDRNEKRVRGIVTGAKRRFEAEGYVDPGVDAEADTLPVSDAERLTQEGMSPMSNAVAAPTPQGIPGSVPAEFWRELNGD